MVQYSYSGAKVVVFCAITKFRALFFHNISNEDVPEVFILQ